MTSCSAPEKDCALCPRLAKFRRDNRSLYPEKFNAPVPSFGEKDPLLLVVGLAPGLRGANFTGRPFTGDYAGDLLYKMLLRHGFAKGTYDRRADDGVELLGARITNAVRCVPPENKPTGAEIGKCRPFLEREISTLKNLLAIIALGTVAHNSVLKALGVPPSGYKFGHGKIHALQPRACLTHPVTLIDSYHCSRYNVNTGRLTEAMFSDAVALARKTIKQACPA